MSAGHASSSRPADWTRAAIAALVAAAVFASVWVVIHHGFYARNHIVDTPVYQRYGDAIADGGLPYRDFTVEYPPAALPAFVLPSLVVEQGDRHPYDAVFGVLMALCGAAAVALVALTLVKDGAGSARLAAGCALAALFPLALGSVVLTRFDLWPAVLATAALAALVYRRDRLAFGLLGIGVAAKIYPIVLLPLFVAFVWRGEGRKRALTGLGIAAAAAAVCTIPFVLASPDGVWESGRLQVMRPLQIESLGSGFLLAAHQAFGLGITMEPSYGSQNLAGRLPDALVWAQAAAELCVLAAIWIWFGRGPAERGRLFRAGAAAVCAFIVFGKVLSPQFLVWLVPLVALVRGRRGLVAGGILVVALALTQLWFPYRYWRLALDFDPAASWFVFSRDLALAALLATLLWPDRTCRGDSLSNAARTEASVD